MIRFDLLAQSGASLYDILVEMEKTAPVMQKYHPLNTPVEALYARILEIFGETSGHYQTREQHRDYYLVFLGFVAVAYYSLPIDIRAAIVQRYRHLKRICFSADAQSMTLNPIQAETLSLVVSSA